MDRRAFVTGSAALAAMPALRSTNAAAAVAGGLVDMHTHVFNDSDIPGWEFFWACVMDHYEPVELFQKRGDFTAQEIVAGLVALQAAVRDQLKETIPTAEAELSGALDPENFAGEAVQNRLTRALGNALLELNNSRDGAFFAKYGPSEPFLDDLGFKDSINPARAEDALKNEINLEYRQAPELMSEGEDGAQALASQIVEGSETHGDNWLQVIGAYFDFVRNLCDTRANNTTRLIALYRPSDGPALFCPALVDFSFWLDKEPVSSIDFQIQAMDEKVQRPALAAVHMQVPFNPWRQIVWDRDHQGTSPLDLVADAIGNRGAVGLKLYPPMGFLPFGNAGAGLTYQKRAKATFGEDFPRLIDDALLRAYSLCVELDVPVLAHAAYGNGAGPGFGDRGRPRNWRPVLSHPDLGKLRICLAHFGSFALQPPPSDENPGEVWEWETVAMMRDFPGRVFTDTAYLAFALPGFDATPEQQTAVNGLEKAAAQGPLDQQLVYGSDWHMLAQVPGNEHYPEAIEAHINKTRLASSRTNIFVRNAVRLYGLRPGDAGFDRLKRYYAANNLDFKRILALQI